VQIFVLAAVFGKYCTVQRKFNTTHSPTSSRKMAKEKGARNPYFGRPVEPHVRKEMKAQISASKIIITRSPSSCDFHIFGPLRRHLRSAAVCARLDWPVDCLVTQTAVSLAPCTAATAYACIWPNWVVRCLWSHYHRKSNNNSVIKINFQF
jgi:hypothetical protein